jgi:hypothetical protein
MYTLNEKYSGMYRLTINGKPVKEHVRSVDVFLTARYNKEDQGLLKIKATALDGRVIEFGTDGQYTIGKIVDEICRGIRG